MPAAPILVLVEPQDIVNIAAAVRIAKNFGIEDLRLVKPQVFDPWRIEGIAHNTADLVDRIRLFDTLDEAVADCGLVVGLTARARAAKRSVLRPRAAALDMIARLAEAPVAMVAGREDKGLTNAELDRCHLLVTIPTTKEYSSLNLAQAVAIMGYETWLARGGEEQPVKPPRHEADPALNAQLEMLFRDWETALWSIEFFKTRQTDMVMRSLREILYRARMDGREAALIRAMGIEVRRYLERKGLKPGDGPHPLP
ncbi:MAG TPA: RNA methyltransferase [Gemmatimonadales bacterium]|jgi:TrmH family RNA methyltransferase|nr:RNA methyltransferase [Gemmatimonadales bacterium]